MKRQWMMIVAAVFLVVLPACNSNSTNPSSAHIDSKQGDHTSMSHSDMNHSGSGEIPAGLKEAKNPAYQVGSQAVIQAEHMPGMNGAVASIVGAYDTTVYVVSYTPITGGEEVTNHKWVIQQEIKDAGSKAFQPGEQVTLEADHMNGMKGAVAKVDSAEQTTVYMVDYSPITGGDKVTNHQWVTERELAAP